LIEWPTRGFWCADREHRLLVFRYYESSYSPGCRQLVGCPNEFWGPRTMFHVKQSKSVSGDRAVWRFLRLLRGGYSPIRGARSHSDGSRWRRDPLHTVVSRGTTASHDPWRRVCRKVNPTAAQGKVWWGSALVGVGKPCLLARSAEQGQSGDSGDVLIRSRLVARRSRLPALVLRLPG